MLYAITPRILYAKVMLYAITSIILDAIVVLYAITSAILDDVIPYNKSDITRYNLKPSSTQRPEFIKYYRV